MFGEARGLKINARSKILDEADKFGILRRARWLMINRARESIERKDKSFRATEKQGRRRRF